LLVPTKEEVDDIAFSISEPLLEVKLECPLGTQKIAF